MGQLDVGDHQVWIEGSCRIKRVAAVGNRLGLMAVRREQVAEQLDVEGIVLDDQYLGQFASFTPLSRSLGRGTPDTK